jgi:Flp pilus assembly pilin Flp
MKETIGVHLKELWHIENGQDLIEYSLLLSFIALGAMAVLVSAGGSIKTLWTGINSQLTSVAS